ncbi:hypothetical protein FOXG_19627 [Fusarium oxysporum f. sp. lycopersici 4287]|uniref:Uncharacterized protein n=1 Tax=Fusarium oxysporum f. sp. lycopersici (strain 4287 / CBS 123668 / FGSC 9935 / NRRL 34936) TaxID=426428 RepID=A0A0J9V625_FUSO4|nr:hypothetical protein FOXG_19627 [Fusarium oxysporum f. sp. lycopersici 4287]KAJ9419660.1 hypothetical protein QL093DRAFT_2118199 [Fusarium oxysporum]KNB06291.1 hypothetical protein FOXG_19627 [Fusarium oxysporum f. sp. lycopersici 4287]
MTLTAEETATMANENRAAILIRVAMVLMSLAVLVVGLRLWCRRLIRSMGLDDIAAVITWACII